MAYLVTLNLKERNLIWSWLGCIGPTVVSAFVRLEVGMLKSGEDTDLVENTKVHSGMLTTFSAAVTSWWPYTEVYSV